MRAPVLVLILSLGLPGPALAAAPDGVVAADPRAGVPVRWTAGETRPRGYRAARFRGGQGATWKQGRDAHGFSGSYGGCSYRGHAGPGGYRLDRRC